MGGYRERAGITITTTGIILNRLPLDAKDFPVVITQSIIIIIKMIRRRWWWWWERSIRTSRSGAVVGADAEVERRRMNSDMMDPGSLLLVCGYIMMVTTLVVYNITRRNGKESGTEIWRESGMGIPSEMGTIMMIVERGLLLMLPHRVAA